MRYLTNSIFGCIIVQYNASLGCISLAVFAIYLTCEAFAISNNYNENIHILSAGNLCAVCV